MANSVFILSSNVDGAFIKVIKKSTGMSIQVSILWLSTWTLCIC